MAYYEEDTNLKADERTSRMTFSLSPASRSTQTSRIKNRVSIAEKGALSNVCARCTNGAQQSGLLDGERRSESRNGPMTPRSYQIETQARLGTGEIEAKRLQVTVPEKMACAE